MQSQLPSEQEQEAQSLYVGGVQAGIQAIDILEALVGWLRLHKQWHPEAEWTLETPVAALQPGYLRRWRRMGFNRLNVFGAASMAPASAHSSPGDLVDRAAAYGLRCSFEWECRVTPHKEDLLRQLDPLRDVRVEHFSLNVYPSEASSLKVSPRLFWELLAAWRKQHGYEAYHYHHFGRRGARGRYNLAVYQGAAYAGLGPGAAGSDGYRMRYRHAEEVATYCYRQKHGQEPATVEWLSPRAAFEEWVMLQLHLPEGLSQREVAAHAGAPSWKTVRERAGPFLAAGILKEQDGRLMLVETRKDALDDVLLGLLDLDK